VDNSERFCAHFLLSLNGDNHVPLYTAMFLRDICSMVRERTQLDVELDDIAFRIGYDGLICGYIQFRTGCLRDIYDWVKEDASLWLIDSYGPVFYETNSSVIGHHTIKAWQEIVHAAVECVFFQILAAPSPLNDSFEGSSHIPLETCPRGLPEDVVDLLTLWSLPYQNLFCFKSLYYHK
jgi:hypothetical protein